jgi:hypothetical protein
MTKRQIEARLAALGLRLEKPSRHAWIVRPDTVGTCHERQVIVLNTLYDVAELIDLREIATRE